MEPRNRIDLIKRLKLLLKYQGFVLHTKLTTKVTYCLS